MSIPHFFFNRNRNRNRNPHDDDDEGLVVMGLGRAYSLPVTGGGVCAPPHPPPPTRRPPLPPPCFSKSITSQSHCELKHQGYSFPNFHLPQLPFRFIVFPLFAHSIHFTICISNALFIENNFFFIHEFDFCSIIGIYYFIFKILPFLII